MGLIQEGEQATGKKWTRRDLIKVGAFIGGVVIAEELNQNADRQRYDSYLKEKEGTGGYLLKDVSPGIIQVDLLDSGKYSRSAPDLFKGSDMKDIRSETLANALKRVGETYEIVNLTSITDGAGGTIGMFVQVKNK